MRQLGKFFNLTTREKRLLIETFLLLGGIRLGLWLLPFPTLQRLLADLNQVNLSGHNPITTDQIIAAVNRSSRYLPGYVKCLARALTTQVLMLRSGHSCELCIGVAKGKKGQFKAHAWVESQGQIVIGKVADLARYTPMSALSRGRL